MPMEEDSAIPAADCTTTTTASGSIDTQHSVQLLPFASLSINSHNHPVQLLPSLSFILELVSRVILRITITGPAKALWRVDLWWEWEILTARGKLCKHDKERGAWGWIPRAKAISWPWRPPSCILTPWEEVADWVKSDIQIFSSMEELCAWWQSQHELGWQPGGVDVQCPWDACQATPGMFPRELLVPMYCVWQWTFFTYAEHRFIREHFSEFTRWLTPKWHCFVPREGTLVREDPYLLDGGIWWSQGVPRLRRGILRRSWQAFRHQPGCYKNVYILCP